MMRNPVCGRLLALPCFLAGTLIGRIPTLGSNQRPNQDLISAHRVVLRRAETARTAALLSPTWDRHRELLEILCKEQELRLVILSDQGSRPLTDRDVGPSSEQRALLALLRLGSQTRVQEQRCENLGFRMFPGLRIAEGRGDNGLDPNRSETSVGWESDDRELAVEQAKLPPP